MKFKNKRNTFVNWIAYNEVFLTIFGFITLPVLFYGIGNFEANTIRNSGNVSEFWVNYIAATGLYKFLCYELVGILCCLYLAIKILCIIVVVALVLLLMFGIVYTATKQPAIIRAAKLPLTVEEIKKGIASGLFSDMQSYSDYIDKQLTFCFGMFHLNFLYKDDNEQFLESATKVFQLKKDDRVSLPIIMRYPNARIIAAFPGENEAFYLF